jgi:diketogulonate reductase-like aldo/keto reductase
MSLSEQQERFCQLVVSGKNQTEAYKLAGYKGSGKQLGDNASRLIANDRVQARIAELRQTAAEKAQIDLQWLIDKGVAILEAAEKADAYGPAVSALKEVGILTGFRIEKSDRTNRTVEDTSDLTRDELYRIARGGREGTAAPGIGQGQLN